MRRSNVCVLDLLFICCTFRDQKRTRYICVVGFAASATVYLRRLFFFSSRYLVFLRSPTLPLLLVTSSRLHSLLPHLEVALVRFLLLFYYIVNNNFCFLRAHTAISQLLAVCVCVVCAYFTKVYSNVFELTNRTNLTMFIIRSISCTMVHFIRSTIYVYWTRKRRNIEVNGRKQKKTTTATISKSSQEPIIMKKWANNQRSHISIFRCFCCSKWSSIYCIIRNDWLYFKMSQPYNATTKSW